MAQCNGGPLALDNRVHHDVYGRKVWWCAGASCSSGQYATCKTAIEHRGYKHVLLDDADTVLQQERDSGATSSATSLLVDGESNAD